MLNDRSLAEWLQAPQGGEPPNQMQGQQGSRPRQPGPSWTDLLSQSAKAVADALELAARAHAIAITAGVSPSMGGKFDQLRSELGAMSEGVSRSMRDIQQQAAVIDHTAVPHIPVHPQRHAPLSPDRQPGQNEEPVPDPVGQEWIPGALGGAGEEIAKLVSQCWQAAQVLVGNPSNSDAIAFVANALAGSPEGVSEKIRALVAMERKHWEALAAYFGFTPEQYDGFIATMGALCRAAMQALGNGAPTQPL